MMYFTVAVYYADYFEGRKRVLICPYFRSIYRGYYTVARRYEFYARVARTISHVERLSMTLRQTANGKNETFADCFELSVQ